jgi:hypothetical protein
MIRQHNRLIPFRQLLSRYIPLTKINTHTYTTGSEGAEVLYLDYEGGFSTGHFWFEAPFGQRAESSGCFWEGLEALEGTETDSALGVMLAN